MAKEQGPKPNDNPLAEVAKTIGSTLGSAANRATEMFREVMPTGLSDKLGVGSAQPKIAAPRSKPKSKPKKSPAKRTAAKKRTAVSRKPAAKKAAKKKALRTKSR